MLEPRDLPPVRGTLSFDTALAAHTWMRVGGPAGALFRPADLDDLIQFLQHKPPKIPHLAIGSASNLIVRDGGLPDTIVIKLGRGFRDLAADGLKLRAGAAQLDINVARFAAKAGLGGLSFLAGVPGTIGGAVRMNAGAKATTANAHIAGGETADRLICARVLDPQGQIHSLSPHDLGMGYRQSDLPSDWIVVEAEFQGVQADPTTLDAEIAAVLAYRAAHQPTKARTCGSTFKNPTQATAWKLIEAAGGRGLRKGDAAISDFHCNFLINLGHATAADLEDLGEDVRARVKAQSGLSLEWEVKRVGVRG